jgi:hypothetical protein
MPDRAETILNVPLQPGRWNTVIRLLPEQAMRLLENQPPQRSVNDGHVSRLADQISRGQWRITHESLAFDEDGLLWDGQHRCWACFNSGIAIDTRASFNEPRENLEITGTMLRARTIDEAMMIAGELPQSRDSKSLLAALRWIWAYDRGANPTAANTQMGFDIHAARDTLARHPATPEHIAVVRRKHPALMATGSLGALATLTHEANARLAAIFLHQFMTGANIMPGDPVYLLRESAINRRTGPSGFHGEMSYRFVRAWNAFVESRTLGILYGSVTPNGAKQKHGGRDRFPAILGYQRPGLLEEDR